jgi:hypothetical protein
MSRSSDDEGPPTTIGYAPSLPSDWPVVAASPERRPAPRATSIVSDRKTVPDRKTFRIEESDTGVRWIANRISEAVAEIVRERATVLPADVSPRPRKEEGKWRSEVEGSGPLDPIPLEGSGESSWSVEEAKEIVASIRRKKKRGR